MGGGEGVEVRRRSGYIFGDFNVTVGGLCVWGQMLEGADGYPPAT